jgi:hypothetical protein
VREGKEERGDCTSEVVHCLQCCPPLKLTLAGHSSMILNVKACADKTVPDEETGVNW